MQVLAAVFLVAALFLGAVQTGIIQQFLDLIQDSQNDPYPMQGNFRPVDRSNFVQCIKPTEGSLPPSLAGGLFARIGPNPFHPEPHYHWFDGQGMIHAVKIGETCLNYTNEWMRNPRMQKEEKLGWNSHLRLGNLRGLIGMFRVLVLAPIYDLMGLTVKDQLRNGAANTAVVFHHGVLNALVENNLPWQVRVEASGQLVSSDFFTFENKWPFPASAHIKQDFGTDELVIFGYQTRQKPYVVTGVVNRQGQLTSGPVALDLPSPVMMHDFAITEHFTIVMDLPFVFDPKRMLKGSPFGFRPDLKARFGVHPRHAKDAAEVKWFTAKPCFIFHTANAWEEKTASGEDVIVLWALRYSNMSMEFGAMAKESPELSQLYEWKFNLKTGETAERALDAPSGEFPVVNRNFLGRKSRYTYYATSGEAADFPKLNGVAKVDLTTGKTLHHRVYGPNIFGGELSFVVGTGDQEDDGYLVGFIHDEKKDKSSFLVLDAKTLAQLSLVELPVRVPFGFHGTFVTQEELLRTA